MRIQQRASNRQHERRYQLGIPCVQAARRALWMFAVLALLAIAFWWWRNRRQNGTGHLPS